MMPLSLPSKATKNRTDRGGAKKRKLLSKPEEKGSGKSSDDATNMPMMCDFNSVLAKVLEKPSLWRQPEFENLREFVEKVSNDPRTFPRSLASPFLCRESSQVSPPPPMMAKGTAACIPQQKYIRFAEQSLMPVKCIPLKPPIPSKFQGDMELCKGSPVPEHTSLVNFQISHREALPEGMRCCVMCGKAWPCSSNKKAIKSSSEEGSSAGPGGNDNSSKNVMIPTQNKGLCTLCDVNVWVVVSSGLEIKWCKGCKNFRPWAAFGDKGVATKCVRCRERQKEKYAFQKEEKARAATNTES
jgi:Zn-finger nucleic acid-binding protein